MKIDIVTMGPDHGDVSIDDAVVPGDDQQRAAAVLLAAGWETVSCSRDNGVRTTYSRNDEDIERLLDEEDRRMLRRLVNEDGSLGDTGWPFIHES